jgi:type II secretory pathway pseudopilin PulG
MILVAVVMFAALSMIVAGMLRGGNPRTVADDKAQLYANEILSYARAMRQNVQSMKISNNCRDLEISFENSTLTGYAHTPAAQEACRLFNANGGSMNYMVPPTSWLHMEFPGGPALRGKWFFPANTCVPGLGTAPAGGCKADSIDNEALIAILPYVRKDICVHLNDKLGVENPGGEPPAETDNAWLPAETIFTGTQADGEQIDAGGYMAACFEGAGSNDPPANSYHFYQVLLPR